MSDRIDLEHEHRENSSFRVPFCEWLRRHGVNPNDVIVPGWIERQVDTYRVAWLGLALDERGKPRTFIAEDGHRDFVTETRYVQLEGPPLPFPELAPSVTEEPR